MTRLSINYRKEPMRIRTLAPIAILATVLINLAIFGGLAWIVIHFVHKFW